MTDESTALIPAPKAEVTVVDADPNARLSTWVVRYWQDEVDNGTENTVAAKRRDLQSIGIDHVHGVDLIRYRRIICGCGDPANAEPADLVLARTRQYLMSARGVL